MLRMLALLATVCVAWTLSQYLPANDFPRESMTGLASNPAPTPAKSSGDAWSVALLDIAIASLPKAVADEARAADIASPVATASPAVMRLAAVAVTAAPSAVATAASAQPATTADEPPDPVAEAKLARRIQKELRRVGCLKTAVDGRWGADSRRAMRRFADRVNADQPVDRPDYVLLMLVETFADRACGTPCPSGNLPNAHGRCVASDLVAGGEPAEMAGVALTAVTALSAESTVAELPAAGPATVQQLSEPGRTAAKSRSVKTRITRDRDTKRAHVTRLVASSKRTRWSLPRYGLGVTNVGPADGAAKPRKKLRMGAAGYRRWLKRTGLTLR
jgi:hypothetical protein